MAYRKTIAIDFDGVLHRYSKGWQGGVIYDPPMEGAFDACKVLKANGYDLVVFTVREDLAAVLDWMTENNLAQFFTAIQNEKPIAVLYIDDRALHFDGDWSHTMHDLHSLRSAGRI